MIGSHVADQISLLLTFSTLTSKMHLCRTIWASLFACTLCLTSAWSTIDRRVSLNNNEIQQELGRRLSDNTKIYFPFDSEFANYTERWSEADAPGIAVVVVPAIAQDVATTASSSNL